MQWICPGCGNMLPEGTPVCPYCGIVLQMPAAPVPPMPAEEKKKGRGGRIALTIILSVVGALLIVGIPTVVLNWFSIIDVPVLSDAICSVAGHDWDGWTVAQEAGCEESGTELRRCRRGESHTETRELAPVGHDWGNWQLSVAPSCDTAGEETRICLHDFSHSETRSLPALGHAWGSWQRTREPSCTARGEERRVCTRNSAHTETRVVAALGHDYLPATYTDPAVCSRCGQTTGKVRGYVGSVSGTWSSESVSLGTWETQYYRFNSTLQHCMRFTMHFSLTKVDGGNVQALYGPWIVYGRDAAGNWSALGYFQLSQVSVGEEITREFFFDDRPSLTGIAVVPDLESGPGHSFNFQIDEIQVWED